jgi:light-independent protochlorophyllide reductase subunit N
LATLVPDLPPAGADAPPNLIVAGSLPDVVEDQFARLFDAFGLGPVGFLPARRVDGLPPVGPSTRVLLAQPFLGDTARALEVRGARRIEAPFPIGVEGTTAWLSAAAHVFGVSAERVRRVVEPAEARARVALDHHRERLRGRRVFFFPDSQLEIPIARFLARELDVELVEVGTPYLHRAHLAAELAMLPAGTTISEGAGRGSAAGPLSALRDPTSRCAGSGSRTRSRRGAEHEVVHRARVHAHPRLRAGRRPRRAVRPPPRAAPRG